MADYDPRIVDLYDEDNPDGVDHDFYREVADREEAHSILDLGCGTGMLTVTLARDGRRVVGVDPSERMLARARRRVGGDRVEWVPGDSRDIPSQPFDLAIMTGNVAQHITGEAWPRTLRDLHRALTPNGLLAFESRNPAQRAWEEWASAERTTRESRQGVLHEWYETVELSAGLVRLTAHTIFESSDDHDVYVVDLAFRDRAMLEYQLIEAGFRVDFVHSDWQRAPFLGAEALIIVEARAS